VKVVVAGGTGFIGRPLVEALLLRGWQVTVLSRSAAPALPAGVRAARWDGGVAGAGAWRDAVAQADAVVNLAGESIGAGRWTAERKRRILQSRVGATRALVEAMVAAGLPQVPRVLVSASAVGFYGPRGDEPVTEDAGPGSDFLSRVCVAWEAEARRAAGRGVRVALPRIGLVLAADGGALPRMALPFRLFAGGPLGSGRQWVPWIHREDLVALLLLLITEPAAHGPVNAVAPEPVTGREFARALGRALRRPSWLPAPAAALRLLLGEAADGLLLSGQRALPRKAEALGYRFRHPTLAGALAAIYRG
jgi:uncharacterized protein (TIGR01777 family)